jgi:hypothetical protein
MVPGLQHRSVASMVGHHKNYRWDRCGKLERREHFTSFIDRKGLKMVAVRSDILVCFTDSAPNDQDGTSNIDADN